MRERVALIFACAAVSAVLALLAHDLIYPTNFDILEPSARLEYEMAKLAAKEKLLILLFGGLLTWISQGKGRD